MGGKVKIKKEAMKRDSLVSVPGIPDFGDMDVEELTSSTKKKRIKKKRSASEIVATTLDDTVKIDSGEVASGDVAEDDLNEPTMGERIAILNTQENNMIDNDQNEKLFLETNLPIANSINILLRQALRADDRALLLDCLYTQDEKVIANSVSSLSPSDVLKLFHALLSNIESRGAILACTLPWLKNLLLQHASGVMSQESSLRALNSLYQVIKSRVSTFPLALDVSGCLDFSYAGVTDETLEENETIIPVIFQDEDYSNEDDSDDSMQPDQNDTDRRSDGYESSD